MKKIIHSTFCFLVAVFFSTFVSAQINIGGQPFSFNNDVNINEKSSAMALMPAIDMDKITAEDEEAAKLGKIPRYASLVPVSLNLNNSGTWKVLPNGDRIWILKIQSPGAIALMLLYDNFFLPQGASMYIYNQQKNNVIGGFTKANNHSTGVFSTSLVEGDVSIIEYYEPKAVKGKGIISISDVGHAYRMVNISTNINRADFCQVDVVCSPESDNWLNEVRSSVRISTVDAGGSYWCSGSLVNNTNSDCTPYILTALHCGESSTAAHFNQYIFYFNYERTTCGSGPASTAQSITGSVKRADSNDGGGSSGSDFLLVELNSAVPPAYNAYYSGWNAGTAASPSGVSIHHPSGSEKKISTYTTALTTTGWLTSNTHWRVLWAATTNGHGVTEGGSSGSPIYDNNKRIVGTLTGGQSYCTQIPTPSADQYGKMSWHWTQNPNTVDQKLKRWLDPNNTGLLTFDGTFAPCGTVFPNDASVFAILFPTSTISTCGSTISPQVTIRNYGSSTLTSVKVNYQINTGPVQTQTITGLSLATNTSASVSLNPISISGTGTKTITIYTSNPNGAPVDDKPANDSKSTTFSLIAASPTTTVPFHQGFETSLFPPYKWSRVNPDNSTTWARKTALGGFGYSTACARLANYGYSSLGERDYLITPEMSFVGLSAPVVIDFTVAYAKYVSSRKDSLIVSVSTDCGGSWTRIYAQGNSTLPTNGGANTTSLFTPTADQWRKEFVNLDSYIGQADVKFRFENVTGNGNILYLDDINIYDVTTASVKEISSQAAISIYPNPSSGNIFAEIGLPYKADQLTINVYSVLGKRVYQTSENNTKGGIFQLNLSHLSEGLYFVEINTGSEKTVQKLVLQNQ